MSKSARIVLACLILVVAVVVGWREYARYHAKPQPKFIAETTPIEDMNVQALDDDIKYEIVPTLATVSDIASRARAAVYEAIADLPIETRLDEARAQSLAEAAEIRFRLMLAPSFDDWIARVVQFAPRPDLDKKGKADAKYRERWEDRASKLRLAPLSLERLIIRPLRVRGRKIEYPESVMMFYPEIRAKYPVFEDPEALALDVYEIYFPLHYTTAKAKKPNLRTWCGIAYAWDRETARWVPNNLTFYSNGTSEWMKSPVF